MIIVTILTVGDEICIGQVINSNAAWIAAQCTRLGCRVPLHITVPDEKGIMLSELDRLLGMSDVVIMTGGLGPTHDDITKDVLIEYFRDIYVLHQPTLEYIETFYKKRGIPLSERNREQAMVPSKCIVYPNTVGTAPGMIFRKGNKFVVSLPGVPKEMMSILENNFLSLLEEIVAISKKGVLLYKTLHTIGVAESVLADLIGDTNAFLKHSTLAFLPSYRGVRLRIGASGEDFNEAREKINVIEKIIRERVGKYIFGEDDESLNSVVGKLLAENNKTVSVAESCTGGLLGGAFTDITGSSDYFVGGVIAYDNDAKINFLNIKSETLEQFGAVSEQTALEMAQGVRLKFNTDYGISITGIAGPTGGTPEKPVGTVWIAIADGEEAEAKKYIWGEDREMNRERAVGAAMGNLYSKLKIKN